MDWFNQVDATYRSDLRGLNELNFARFDAKVEQRIAQLDAKLEQRLAQLDAKWQVMWSKLDAKIDGVALDLRADLARQKTELIRWMVGLWLATLVPVSGLVLGLFVALH